MRRRILFLTLSLASVVALLVAAAPAVAVTAFGPTVTVASAPGGGTIDNVGGDAADPVAGVSIRGFFNFSGSGLDADEIRFVGGRGSSWKTELSPYRGQVIAVDQYASGTYVVFVSSSGIHLGHRFSANGAYSPSQQLSPTAPGAVFPQGAVLATSGGWWAVWSEQVGPGGEFAQTELFQAKTIGGVQARTQITNNPDNDHQPQLALRPGGGAELVWVRDDAFGQEPTHSHIRLATASGSPGTWTSRQFTTVGINHSPSIDTTPGPGGHTYIAWVRGTQPFESDDRSGAFAHRSFAGDTFAVDVDSSGGQVHVVWPQVGDGTVLAERSSGGTWTKAGISGIESELSPIVLSVSGQATVLMASPNRIFARTQVS